MHVLPHAQVSASEGPIGEALTWQAGHVCFSEQECVFLPLPSVANPTYGASHTPCLIFLKPPFFKIWFSSFKACHYCIVSFGG